ncbi:MAG: hypothetical protein Ct9H90mP14_2170 [Methanobacteriota archaeon]|nr:MAG: hypothetical protein Ct9H90mP14_2170 [Euryarchaeota archaeon]
MKVKGPDDLAGIVLKPDGDMDDPSRAQTWTGRCCHHFTLRYARFGTVCSPKALAMLEMGGGKLTP